MIISLISSRWSQGSLPHQEVMFRNSYNRIILYFFDAIEIHFISHTKFSPIIINIIFIHHKNICFPIFINLFNVPECRNSQQGLEFWNSNEWILLFRMLAISACPRTSNWSKTRWQIREYKRYLSLSHNASHCSSPGMSWYRKSAKGPPQSHGHCFSRCFRRPKL